MVEVSARLIPARKHVQSRQGGGRTQRRRDVSALRARYERDGRNVSDTPTSPTYDTTLFCKERDANGVRKEDFAAAMRRLFEGGKIHVENYGRPSRPASRLRLGKKEESSRESGQVS